MKGEKLKTKQTREIGNTCVPDLKTHDGIGVGVYHAFCEEASADGGGCLGWVECAFAVAHDERRLAHILSAEDHDLGLERRHISKVRGSRTGGVASKKDG